MPRGPSAHGLDPWGTRALPAPCSRQGQAWRALVRAGARRSHPASLLSRPPGPAFGRPEDRLRAPRLCRHALVVTAPHGPADQPSRHQHQRFGRAAEPWRGARSQAAALIVFGELPRSPRSGRRQSPAAPCRAAARPRCSAAAVRPPGCARLQDARRPPACAGAGPRRVGLKLRMPSRARVDFIRFTIHVRSPTRQSRLRFGRLASSSAIVGTRAMLQWPRSPRSHPKNPRFGNSVSSRSVFARRCSRIPRHSRHGSREPLFHAPQASAPAKTRRGRLRRQPQSA